MIFCKELMIGAIYQGLLPRSDDHLGWLNYSLQINEYNFLLLKIISIVDKENSTPGGF